MTTSYDTPNKVKQKKNRRQVAVCDRCGKPTVYRNELGKIVSSKRFTPAPISYLCGECTSPYGAMNTQAYKKEMRKQRKKRGY